MPLPKSCSMAARATEVYTETWSAVLTHCWDLEPMRTDDVTDLYLLLPYLRQLLTCCACAGLLDQAMVSLSCGHCYCYECQYKTPLLKIQCRQCRERTGLVIESQLRLVVEAYREMCHVLWEEFKARPVRPSTAPENGKEENEKEKNGSNTVVEVNDATTGFDPISEILQEVRQGTKVSRAVLIVKPPLKYINSKGFVTPRKEPVAISNTVKAPPLSSQLDKVEAQTIESDAPNSQSGKVERASEEATCSKDEPTSPKSKTIEKANTTSSHQKSKKSKKQKSKSSHHKPDESWVRVEACGATSSEEDIDIMNVVEYSTTEFHQDKLNTCKISRADLEVSRQSLRQDFLDFGETSIGFHSDAASLSFRGGGKGHSRNAMIRIAGTSRRRSRNPFTPRVSAKKVRVEHCVWASTKDTLPQGAGLPRSELRHRQARFEEHMATMHQRPVSYPLPLFFSEHGNELPPRMLPYPPSPHRPPPPYTPPRPSPPHTHTGFSLIPPPHPPPPPHPHHSRMHFAPPLLLSTPPPRSSYVGHPIMIPTNSNPTLPIPLMMTPHGQQHHGYPQLPSMFIPPPTTSSSSVGPRPSESPPSTTAEKKARRSFLHGVWRCRCGTNNVMHPEKVCARAKCPCFSKGKACERCLCRDCKNPYKETSSK